MAVIEVNWRPGRGDLRSFGYLCLVVFGGVGTWVLLGGSLPGVTLADESAHVVGTGLWTLALTSGGLGLVAPSWLRPLYVLLTALALPIGFVVSHVLMAVLFYGLLTSIALFFRLKRRDPLDRRFDRDAASYWTPRRQARSDRYFRQF